jgi:hypothetical protein
MASGVGQCTVFKQSKTAWFDPPLLAGKMDEVGFVRSLLDVLGLIKAELLAGTPMRRIVLGGFSQGGCIANHIGLMAKDVRPDPHPPPPPLALLLRCGLTIVCACASGDRGDAVAQLLHTGRTATAHPRQPGGAVVLGPRRPRHRGAAGAGQGGCGLAREGTHHTEWKTSNVAPPPGV